MLSIAEMLSCQQVRRFSTTLTRLGGQKAKRRKQRQRVDNPHLPFKSTAASPTKLAMAHFDELYSGLYKHKWPSIRLGLLSPGKHCALVNNFGDSEETVDKLTDMDCINIGEEFRAAHERMKAFVAPPVDEVKNDEEIKKPVISSLNPEMAKSRMIYPEERIFGASG